MQISVLIATRNRADILRQTLAAFRNLETNNISWELIVVDNGSTDATQAVLAEAAAALPLIVLTEPEPGKNRALNRALAVAQGELFVFTDDDVIPVRDWLRAWWDFQSRWPHDDVFGARIIPRFPPETPDWMRAPDFVYASLAFGWCELAAKEQPVNSPPFGANLAIRAALFREFTYNEKIGPAGANYAQGSEHELLVRLQQAGKRFIFSPLPALEHLITKEQTNVDWLMGRAFRVGRGYARVRSAPRKKIAGVPWTVWPRYFAHAAAYHLFHRFRSDRQRFESGRAYHFFRGCVFEHRTVIASLNSNTK